MTLPRGYPPIPSAWSRAIEPVAIVETSQVGWSPIFIIVPFPKSFSILAIVAVRLATKAALVLLLVGVIVTFVLFNVFQIVLFHMGVLRLTNINALEDLPVSLSPNDPNALAKAEEMVRSKNLAGSTKAQRVAQAQQLKESIELAKSLRGGEAAEQAPQPNPKPRSRARSAGVRCRFVRLSASNEAGIKRMSALATHIVREYFDPIVGSEQNDYMIARYESPKAIARQLADGFEYYFVLPPKRADEEQGTARPIGLVSVRDQGDGELCLNKFYLVKGARGKGCARSMMRLAMTSIESWVPGSVSWKAARASLLTPDQSKANWTPALWGCSASSQSSALVQAASSAMRAMTM